MEAQEYLYKGIDSAGKTILIADDDHTTHISYKKILTKAGFNVEHAYDGLETFDKACTLLPDIILLDISMPYMDGRDICQKLKSEKKTNRIKIIMLTSKDQQHDRLVGFEAGADEYIIKPCSPFFLTRTLRTICSR